MELTIKIFLTNFILCLVVAMIGEVWPQLKKGGFICSIIKSWVAASFAMFAVLILLIVIASVWVV